MTSNEPIPIGAIQPLTGSFSAWGQAHSAGLEFAVEQINDSGGVLGRELEIVERDSGGDPETAQELFETLVAEEGAVAVTGPVSSRVGLETRRTAEELDVPVVFHMAGSHRILPPSSRYGFRLGRPTPVPTVRSALELCEAKGWRKIGMIVAQYEWGRSVRTATRELIPDEIELHAVEAPLETTDFEPYLDQLPSDVDIFLGTAHPPGAIDIHKQAVELGFDHKLTLESGIPPHLHAERIDDEAVAARLAHEHVSDPQSEAFLDVATQFYEARGERFDTHEAYGYSAGEILAQAIETAGSTAPTAIADAIRGGVFDSLHASPIQYADNGNLDQHVTVFSTLEFESPAQFPDGEWRLNEIYRSDPHPTFDLGMMYRSVESMQTSLQEQLEELERTKQSLERSNEQLERQNERLSALFANSQSVIIEYVFRDGEVIIENANERFEDLFGYETATIIGDPLDEYIRPPQDHDTSSAIQAQLRRGAYLDEEVKRRTVDGTRTFLVRNTPINTDDEIRGYASYTDITKQKERERKLRRQNERLDQFAGIVSHDLRNPLSIAEMYLDLARDSGDEADFDAVAESLDRMDEMIEDLLAMSRAGMTVEDPEPVPLADVVDESYATAQTDEATLDLAVPDATTIEAEPDRLQHVFENLFRNAVDHNDPPLTIRVGLLDDPSGRSGFFIEDDGSGIPEAERGDVFDHGYTTDTDGTGFGLSIVEDIVTAHDWDITITESDAGGARFEIHTTETAIGS